MMLVNFFTLAIVGVVFYYFYSKRNARKAYAKSGPSLHCMTCGEDFKPPIDAPLRGSGLVELALWFTFFGGLIYSIWRRSSNFKMVCPMCKATTVVPIESKAAKAHNAALAKAG